MYFSEEDSQAHWLANVRMRGLRGVFRGRANVVMGGAHYAAMLSAKV